MAQFELLGAIAFGGPVRALSRLAHLPAASIGISWTTLIFLLALAALGGLWWGWLHSGSPVGKPENEADLIELGMLRAVVASLPDLIYVKDAQSRFLLANEATTKAMGAQGGNELLGRTDFDFYPQDVAQSFFSDEQKVIKSGRALVSQDESIRGADGHQRWIMTSKIPLTDGRGHAIGIVGIGRDITAIKQMEEELRAAQRELEFKASHDCLTGLINRGAVVEALEREFERARRAGSPTAVLLCDLDHFKNVNDSYGHPVGDEVLSEVARRLAGAVRNYDSVGRFGGEEFLIVLSRCGDGDAHSRAEHLRRTIADTPINTQRGPVPMTMSFGVLVNEGREILTVDQALREVDLALYAAKAGGRNQCCVAHAEVR